MNIENITTFKYWLYFVSRFNPEDSRISMIDSIAYSLSAMTTYGSRMWPKKFGSQIAAFSLLIFGYVIWAMWEAMLVSYLSAIRIDLPFNNMEELMTNTDYKIIVMWGSFFEDAFKFAQDPLWKRAYTERVLPTKEEYGDITSEQVQVDTIAENLDLALYTAHFNVR